jgi:ABC-type Fe3+ transport system permease subunit
MLIKNLLQAESKIEELSHLLRMLKIKRQRISLVSVMILTMMMPALMMTKTSEKKKEKREEEKEERRRNLERGKEDQLLKMKIWPVMILMILTLMLEDPLERAEER